MRWCELVIPLKDRLDEDRRSMYDGMVQIGQDNAIWQNRLIWAICKTLWDILEWIGRKDGEIH